MTSSLPPTQQRPPIFEFLDVLRRRGLWILLVTLVVGAAVFVHEASKPATYQATSLINYEPSQQNLESLLGVSQSNSDQNINGVTNPQLLTAASLAVSPSVAASASQALGGNPSTAQILRDVTVTADDTGATILQVSASDVSADVALRVSRGYADAYVAAQTNAEQATVTTAIARVATQIKSTERTDPQGKSILASLYERQSQLQQINLLSQPPVTVGLLASTAVRNQPNTLRTALLAAVIALILTLSVAVIFERAVREDRVASDDAGDETLPVENLAPLAVPAAPLQVDLGAPLLVSASAAQEPQPVSAPQPQPQSEAPRVRPAEAPISVAASAPVETATPQTSSGELAMVLWLRVCKWFVTRVLSVLRVDSVPADASDRLASRVVKSPSA